jgi:signal transduction protein with GAF and PtsI domain
MCRLCGELAKAPDLNTTLQILAQNITKIMGVKGTTVRLLDEKKQTLEIVAIYGLSKTYLQKGTVILKDHPVDQKVLKGQTISTKDIAEEPHVLYLEDAKKEGIKSVLSVPLTAGDRPIGVVRVYTSTPHDFTAEEIERLRLLVSFGGSNSR